MKRWILPVLLWWTYALTAAGIQFVPSWQVSVGTNFNRITSGNWSNLSEALNYIDNHLGIGALGLSTLRTTSPTEGDGSLYEVSGHTTPTDGGEGVFEWDASATNADDGGYIIQVTGTETGRWIRKMGLYSRPEMWGGFANDTNDDTYAIWRSLTWKTGMVSKLSPGQYLISASIGMPDGGVGLEGSGMNATEIKWQNGARNIASNFNIPQIYTTNNIILIHLGTGGHISDLTINCNQENAPSWAPSATNSYLVTIGGIHGAGWNTRIERVAATHWGAGTPGFECFLFHLTAARESYDPAILVRTGVGPIIRDCLVTDNAPSTNEGVTCFNIAEPNVDSIDQSGLIDNCAVIGNTNVVGYLHGFWASRVRNCVMRDNPGFNGSEIPVYTDTGSGEFLEVKHNTFEGIGIGIQLNYTTNGSGQWDHCYVGRVDISDNYIQVTNALDILPRPIYFNCGNSGHAKFGTSAVIRDNVLSGAYNREYVVNLAVGTRTQGIFSSAIVENNLGCDILRPTDGGCMGLTTSFADRVQVVRGNWTDNNFPIQNCAKDTYEPFERVYRFSKEIAVLTNGTELIDLGICSGYNTLSGILNAYVQCPNDPNWDQAIFTTLGWTSPSCTPLTNSSTHGLGQIGVTRHSAATFIVADSAIDADGHMRVDLRWYGPDRGLWGAPTNNPALDVLIHGTLTVRSLYELQPNQIPSYPGAGFPR